MLNKMITITSLFMMLLSSVSGYARVKWNEYHEDIVYFNYEGQNIVLKDLPSLPSQKIDKVDIRNIHPSDLLSVGQGSSIILDSLLRKEINERSDSYLFFLSRYSPFNESLSFWMYDKSVEIKAGIDSYLIYAIDFSKSPYIFLVNVKQGVLVSVLQVSGRVSYEKKDALTAIIQDGRIDLYEQGYESKFHNGQYSNRYVSNKCRHLTEFRMNEMGYLSLIKNYSLLYSKGILTQMVNYRDSSYDMIRAKMESDTIKYANYGKENLIRCNLTGCDVSKSHKVDIKKVIATPVSSFSPVESSTIGPALCHDNWTENSFFWLNQIHCRDSVKSYLVLVIGIGGSGPSRIFICNFKRDCLMSVALVSSVDVYNPYKPNPYIYSSICYGRIIIHNDYGKKAVYPMRFARDYNEDNTRYVDYYVPTDVNEKYDVLHYFNLYESNMPKSSKYVLLLDKDGYLTRK